MAQAILKFGHNTFSSLKIRNYRLYFTGQVISLCGTWMQTVALGWLVLTLTGSGTQLGLIVAAQFVPMLFFGPWGGLVADRADKRRLLMWTQFLFGVLAGGISILIFTHLIQVWMLYVFGLGLGVLRIFDNPARQTFVQEMVGSDNVKNAVSLNSTAQNIARAVGPSIGGILIAAVNIGTCFLLNAISFIAVIAMLYAMREHELHRGTAAPKKAGQIREGFRYVKETPLIKDVLIMMAVIGTFAYEFNISLPLLAERTFHSGAGGYAILMSAYGIGAIVGGLFSASRHKVAPHQFVIFTLLFGVSMIGTALAPTIALACLGMFFVGIFSINSSSLGNTMIQLESAPEMRGRVMALWGMAIVGSTPVGGPIVGFLGDHIGARWGLAIGGIASILMILYAMMTLLSKDRLEDVPDSIQIEVDEENIANAKVQ